jgi:hypothetical protein
MKTKQLFISLMLFCLLPLASWAEVYTDPATGVNYYYQVGIAASSVTKSPSVSGDIEILSQFTVDGSTYRVENIDKEAFRDCSNLTNVTIPNSVVNIGIGAFLRSGLTSITIPNSVTNIGSGAFEECHGLTSVIIPNSVTNLGGGAFFACAGLTSITLPNSLTKIDRDAFAYCRALTEIYSYIENPFKVDWWRGVDLKKIQLYVPKGTMDKYQATGGWHEFTNIAEMGEGETPAGNIRFADAEVKRICVENWDTNGDGELSYDEAAAVKNLGQVFKGDIKSFNEFQYFTGVEVINQFAFEFCQNLSSIKFPNSIKEIHLQAFCLVGLTSLTIPKSVLFIATEAFEGCDKLASITVEEGNKVYDSRDNCNAIIYTNSSALIFGCKNTIIPSTVTAIYDGAFNSCIELTSIDIPSKVKYIGSGAFIHSGLTSITIPKSVSNIGEVAFAHCIYLSSIIVEEGNTTFDSRDNCNAIIYTKTNELISGCKSTIIPNTVTAIGKRAFEGIETLTEIVIPNSVTSIAENAFYRTCIDSLHIPSSVKTIGNQAFGNCYKLKTITFEKWPENVGSKIVFYGANALKQVIVFDREPTAISDDTFLNSYNGTWTAATLYVPAGTKALYEATDGWKNFKNIVEMEGETPAGNIKFANAEVKRICVENWDTNGDGELSYDEAAVVTDLGKVFRYNNRITSFDELQHFKGLTSIGYQAFYQCAKLSSVAFPDNVTSIGGGAFYGCGRLSSLTIPNSVTSIEGGAFSHCGSLTSIIIPNSVTSIGKSAFSGNDLTSISVESGNSIFDSRDNCNAIIETATNTLIVGCKNTIIPSSVISIGENAFYDCSTLTSITVPNSITSIGDNAFFGCSGLSSFTIPNNVTSIGNSTFSGCSGLTSVIIPNSVTSIGNCAFYNCRSLSTITIPNSVTIIDRGAFQGSSLTSIIIPSSVTSIGLGAFECLALTSCVVESGNKTYDSRDNCNAIIETATNTLIAGFRSSTIPNSVTGIGKWAFENCQYLSSLTIPNSVTSIGDYAFDHCKGLTEIYSYIEEPFGTNISCWEYVDKSIPLYVPAGTKAKYQTTDGWKNFTNIVEMEDLEPVDEGKDVNFAEGGDITEETDLTGTIVNNMYYNIGTDAGGYNSGDGCIVITKETSDEQMAALEGLGITDEELKQNFTGIIFKVPAGSGKVAVTAETTGNMTLKVKVGNNEPWEMELSGKLKMTVPYNVTEETMVYIFAGTTEHNAARGLQQAGVEPSLRIYGISVESNETGLVGVKALSESVDIYSLDGHLVRKSATSLDGLPEGVYIINGRKVVK